MDEDVRNERFKTLGFKPQKENVFNKLLPYGAELDEESTKLFTDIKTNLIKSVLAREIRPGCALWTSRLIKYIKIYGMKFSKEDHIGFIKLFYELITIPDLEPARINKCAKILVQLLKKKYLLTRDELQLDWRPLYDLCVRVIQKSKNDIGMYRYFQTFESNIFTLIRTSRIYFPASATQEILDEFRPKLCPFNVSDIANTIQYLELFLPISVKPEEANISYNLWFEEFMTLWNICHNACSWENQMMWLMTCLAKYQMGYIDWKPYIPIMFVRFQRILALPVTFKQRQLGKQHKIDIAAIAIWIVAALDGDNNSAFFHLEKLMQSLESYYQPANNGRWSPKLRELLRQLSFYFIQRVHCERYQTPTWEIQAPKHYRLSDDDIDRFVNILKPCVEQAMFSRMGSQDVSLALQYLASLRPNLIVPMTLDKLFNYMYSLTEPHKLTSSMMGVIAVGRYMVQGSRNNYPEGPFQIVPLLTDLLPGIDPNDIRKSYVTFNFIVHFVNMIPLVNCSDASNYYQLTEEEQLTCEATAGFEDFVLQFFDRIFTWVESSSLDFVRMEQIANNSNVKNKIETISESALGSVIGVVLGQCSPSIFMSALKKYYSFVINKIMEVHISGKMVATGVRCFAKVNPKETLKMFVPYLCDRIMTLLNENSNIENEEQIDDELLYNLLILSEVVDGKSELLNYMDQLTNILDKTLHMVSLNASQLASRMLEVIMSSLTSIQPTEIRSSSVDYSTPISEFLPIREWGKAQNINDLKMSWYVPGAQEVAQVQKLVNKYLVLELKKLDAYADGETALSRQELKRTLKIIISVLSCQPLLPMWKEAPVELVESVLDPWAFDLKVCSGNEVITMPDGRNVRKVIADCLHKVQSKLLEVDEGDTKSIQHIIKIYNILLFNKTRAQDFEFHWKSFHMAKRLLEDRLQQKKLHLRHVLIDRVMLQQEFRIESRNCSFTDTHKQILMDLFELSVSRYSEVRVAAQTKLFAIISYFAYSYSVLTEKIKEILQLDSQNHHEKFKGCLYILLGPKSSPIIARHDWQFIRELWPLVVRSRPSEKISIINLIASITDTVHKFFPTITINLIIPQSVLGAAYGLNENYPISDLNSFQSVIDNGVKYLKQQSDVKRNAYEETIDDLIDAVESGNLHWRYCSMSLNFLKDLVHADVKYNARVVRFFLRALINESIIIRKIAIRVVVFIMIQNKPKFKKIEIDPSKYSNVKVSNGDLKPGIREDNKWLLYDSKTTPKCTDHWEETRYVHDEYTGYYCWPKKLEVFDSPSKQLSAAKRMDDLSDIEREIYDFFGNESNVAKLMEYLSLEEKKGRDQFNAHRFWTFKNLFKIFEDKLLPIFLPHIKRLVQDKLESNQRCASEILSGIIRGSKHWEYEKVDKLWSELLPIFEDAIANMCSETQTDWALCITMSLNSRDPNKNRWLLEYLLDDPLKEPTSFIACIRLHLLTVAVSQQSWRNSEIGNRLLEYFRPHLSHPFQNIRDKISSSLTVILSKDLVFPESNFISGPSTQEFFTELSGKFKSLYDIILMKLTEEQGDNNICDNLELSSNDSQEKESSTRLFKLVTKFATTNMVIYNFSARPEFFKLLPLASLLCNNETDEELANNSINLLVVLAQTMTLEKYIPCAIENIRIVAHCPSWSARAVIAEFLPIFVFYNMATINSNSEWVNEILSIVLELLEDIQLEVRVGAAKVLGGLLHCSFISNPNDLLVTFKQKAKTKLKSKRTTNDTSNAIRFRHAGVLGLCAFINAHPYDLPDYLPNIFEHLKSHLSDPQPIPATIRKTLGDFKRTHHDNWESHKRKFTEEELEVLSDLTVPPSYYV